MKKHLQLIAIVATPFLTCAQKDKQHSCSHAKTHTHTKSNTLNVTQIDKTEQYDVHHYFLDLNMTNTSTTLSGSTIITASARTSLDSALIELYPDFVIDSILVNGISTNYSRVQTAVKIPVNANTDDLFTLTVYYAGTPPTAVTNPLGGGGMTNDVSALWGNQITWSLSQPFSAYEWFPVKQSLKDKADSCDVHITVPTACKAGSNGVLQQVVDLGNGTHRFEWKHRHPIDYYLISVAVGKYVEYTVTANPSNSGPVTIQNFIYDNPNTLPFFQNAINETADFLELYAELYGPYPFADEKYGHCMAPVGGGMEHQTMTTQSAFVPSLTSHELAHQWFGDHVTCSSWADIWINEGFASYSEYVMLEQLYPGQQGPDMLDRHDESMLSPTGSVWIEDSLNAESIFSYEMTYSKGAAILHTLRFLVDDDDLYFAAYREFQDIYGDSVASGLDFIHVMENVTGMDFTQFMEEWYFGEGFPTYAARWHANGTDLLLEINQTTSASAITPFFTNDLAIKFSRSGAADTTIRFSISGLTNQYLLPNVGTVINLLSIDPANWIINRNGTIIHDPNLVLGLDETTVEDQIRIFPNPTNGPFTVEMPFKGNYTLVVIDTKGRIVQSSTFDQQTVINLDPEASESYLLQVSDASGTKIRKIVKR